MRRYDACVNPLRRLFSGSGKVPLQLRAELAAEGLVLLEEGLRGSITDRRPAAGERSGAPAGPLPVTGAVALTSTRLVVWAAGAKRVDVPLEGPPRAALAVTLEPPDTLCFAFDAADGLVEVRLRSAAAPTILSLLHEHPA
jgi:hypothetical protein